MRDSWMEEWRERKETDGGRERERESREISN